MMLKKKGRKWVVEGCSGWISKWTFPYKWKAIIGMEIAKNGGTRQDYFKAARKNRPEEKYPYKAIEKMEQMLDDILEIKPTPDEISLYGKENEDAYGVVTTSKSPCYFPPRIHNTWGQKSNGRVHIDLGNDGYHVMLNKYCAQDFIDFVKRVRSLSLT